MRQALCSYKGLAHGYKRDIYILEKSVYFARCERNFGGIAQQGGVRRYCIFLHFFAFLVQKTCASRFFCVTLQRKIENMTTLSRSEKESIMKDMKSFDEPMPAVGIFWYDPEEHDFFGVYKKELTPKMVEDAAEKGLPFINYRTLHRQVWQKQYFRALAKHEPTKFSGDYTQVPRGRVAWNIDKFIVFVGQWAKDKEEELTELIEKYFALPYFEFRYDEHWDLGHGWSGDL